MVTIFLLVAVRAKVKVDNKDLSRTGFLLVYSNAIRLHPLLKLLFFSATLGNSWQNLLRLAQKAGYSQMAISTPLFLLNSDAQNHITTTIKIAN
jgi:hypothetical protein